MSFRIPSRREHRQIHEWRSYLACEGIGCGTCAIAAYDQEYMDLLLGVDGDEEFTIYIAPVGKVRG